MAALSFLDKKNTIAGPGFNRWLIPPAALAIHLSIGQVYAMSTFNEPMTKLIGVTESASGDWRLTTLSWIFSIAIAVLGLSAAFGGRWLERVGPRKAMFAAALCFSGGFFVSSLGVALHSIILVYLGYGVIGGIGLGLGYISPVSTLIKWFPDRPGMATGMAIMGFGGGAMIGGPLSQTLMDWFSGPGSVGVAPTMLVMGALYLALILFGMFIVRVPPEDWTPEGYDPAEHEGDDDDMLASGNVTADVAIKTKQFWLVWAVLFLNVTAGIGVLSQASPMIQEMFTSIGAAAAAGFVGLLSIFNMAGRFGWSSLSDYIGRQNTYSCFFILGAVLYALVPTTGNMGSIVLFVVCFAIILTMYGGGFATVPAYLRDLFGTQEVGAIHGRLLTAWSAAGVVGPVIISYMRDYQINSMGVAPADAYTTTMYIMAALLVIGAVCNFMVSPVDKRLYVENRGRSAADGAPAAEARKAEAQKAAAQSEGGTDRTTAASSTDRQ